MTVTLAEPGRVNASPAPTALPTTTRRQELRENRALDMWGEEKDHRFSAADITAVESMASVELAVLLEKPNGFIADYRAAVRPAAKHELSEDERDRLKALKKSREHSPTEFENIAKALWAQSKDNRDARLRKCRRHAKSWIKLVRLYELNKPWFDPLPQNVRSKLCRDMARGVALASSNDVPSLDRAHERLRAKNNRERDQAARRLRKSFGHRKPRPTIPVKPNGEIDFRALERREMVWMSSTRDGGVSIEGVDQWTATEDLRIAKRLTAERQSFWNREKDTST